MVWIMNLQKLAISPLTKVLLTWDKIWYLDPATKPCPSFSILFIWNYKFVPYLESLIDSVFQWRRLHRPSKCTGPAPLASPSWPPPLYPCSWSICKIINSLLDYFYLIRITQRYFRSFVIRRIVYHDYFPIVTLTVQILNIIFFKKIILLMFFLT